ncbi:MAG: response regulator [Gammaproteobacteria bacterium HGW-Gammaproteobacteria-4]|jgi:DNA-binding response OmpR family regulator|nr:MAG: response regulator [Gammaproteobacteria bacterium HGW-Gammaproteobacteria-4]
MPMPRFLLLEDDPPTRLFLHDTLLTLPAQVQCASTLAQARTAIDTTAFDLYLFDANLPDGRSADLLAHLRETDVLVTAIALTADNDADTTAALLAAGFARVLIKPVATAHLLRAVRELLSFTPGSAATDIVWDRHHALAAAGGVERTRAALNALFLEELPDLQRQIVDALDQDRNPVANDLLHRLKGSCALVGAEALREAVFALAQDTGQRILRDRFVAACQRTLREKP